MHINLWAVLVSAIASMVVGSIWYGPLFGKTFMALMGMNQWSPEKQAMMKKKMGVMYLGQFIASCVMFYVLAGIVVGFGHTSALAGAMTGFIMWLGFVVPLAFGNALWGGKWPLFWLSIGNMLVTLLIAGAIIGAWL